MIAPGFPTVPTSCRETRHGQKKNADKPPLRRKQQQQQKHRNPPRSLCLVVQRRWWQDLGKLGCVHSHRASQRCPAEWSCLRSAPLLRVVPTLGACRAAPLSQHRQHRPLLHWAPRVPKCTGQSARVTWKFFHQGCGPVHSEDECHGRRTSMHCGDLLGRGSCPHPVHACTQIFCNVWMQLIHSAH